MRLLSSIFPQHSLSCKMPLRFNNLDIGGCFSLVTKRRYVFNNCIQLYHTRTYPLISQHEVHHVMLQNAAAIFMIGFTCLIKLQNVGPGFHLRVGLTKMEVSV